MSGDNLGVVILELLEEPFAVRNDDTPEVVLRGGHFFPCGFRRPTILYKSLAVFFAAVGWRWVWCCCVSRVGAVEPLRKSQASFGQK